MDLPTDYQLLSSTRYDSCLINLPWNTLANEGIPSPYLLLRYHFDRLLDAAQLHAWTNAQGWTLVDLNNACDEAVRDALAKLQTSDAPLKVTILLNITRAIRSHKSFDKTSSVFFSAATVVSLLQLLLPTPCVLWIHA